MSQDGSARSDPPADGQKELGGVSHSESMMADIMMLANLKMQNQQLLQQQLKHQQRTAAAGGRELQQQTAAAAGDRGLQQQLAAGAGGRVEESGGAREGRVVYSSGFLVEGTVARLESLSGEARQASLAGRYPGLLVKHP